MERFFNTEGPVNPVDHYTIPMADRLNLEEILELIGRKKYFILHAPRQTGKTSALLALMDLLNSCGEYTTLYVNVEAAQAFRENIIQAMKSIAGEIREKAMIQLEDTYPETLYNRILKESGFNDALKVMLSRWSSHNSKPIVLFIDEIDSLVGDTLISVLRQLRSGYTDRPKNFPQSIILCGVRDIRDYRIKSKGKEVITGGSAYNIKAESLRLGDFSRTEIQKLLLMHTEDTGQIFEPGIVDTFEALTRGQPWLVNALGYQCCFRNKEGRDRSVTITKNMVKDAAEEIIQRRETHLDQLTDKLKEERVRRVILPILSGSGNIISIPEDDVQYVEDLGLIRRKPQIDIANPIYREVIPRALVHTTQDQITHQTAWYITPEGKLDLSKLINAFQQFFREHSEHWLERFDYREAGPQLLMQAFLQRIVNGGGRVEREYALGSMRTDLLVTWPYDKDKKQIAIIELKIRHGSLEAVKKQGMRQTVEYMDRCGGEEGCLIIFDKTPGLKWEDKLFKEIIEYQGKQIPVWGM